MDKQLIKDKGFNKLFNIKKKSDKSLDYYISGLRDGNRFVLSECITLIESSLPNKRHLALKALEETLISSTQKTIRLGITGTPGVGKSTFIESFGMLLIQEGYKPAILTIDPSSRVTQGSILGDKTRMPMLSTHPKAYIRPSASNNILGGIAPYTKDVIKLCEAAGYNFIIIETVGVGQSETEIKDIVDATLLLLQPGAGDEIQGIKRGIVESGDIFVITKADGIQISLAQQTQTYYSQALSLFHHEIPSWTTPVMKVSALEGNGMSDVLQSIQDFVHLLIEKKLYIPRRKNQDIMWFEKQVNTAIHQLLRENSHYQGFYNNILDQLKKESLSTTYAIDQMENFLKKEFFKS